MSIFKQLASQTAVYGLSSILGRLLNYLLVPIYTRIFLPAEYGVVTQLYAYVAFLNIVYTYGLEIAFFRFFQATKGDLKVYSTALFSIIISSVVLSLGIGLFSPSISIAIGSGSEMKPEYIQAFAAILALEAISAIPFAYLRQQNKAKRFAFIRLASIVTNVVLNVYFLMIAPYLVKNGHAAPFYDGINIKYVFIANVISSLMTVVLLAPQIFKIKFSIDKKLWKEMFIYGSPLMVAGLAGMINETFDRILLPMLLTDKADAINQVGIYGACYKVSIVMTLFIQTFRYAAEPFFFNQSVKENAQLTYAAVMNWFVLVAGLIFAGVMLYIEIFQELIGPAFRSGLKVVPILLMANLCIGVYYNLSVWYKLTGKTRWGAYMSVIGAAITLLFNFLLIPIMGYMGAAWTTLICYAAMMIICYLLGQKNYHIPYQLDVFFLLIIASVAFWLIGNLISSFVTHYVALFILKAILIAIYAGLGFLYVRKKNSYLRPIEK